jgi:multidrug efflux pump
MNFSHFFIRRPIFAAVLSIVIVLVGGIAMFQLPIAQYPNIVPPTVVVRAVYPGANPTVLAETVATPIEQEVNGVEDMLYMSSTSTSDGVMSLTITFKLGTDLNTAQVLVQNRVAIALAKLPVEVRRIGVTTTKRSSDLTMVAHLFSLDSSRDESYLGNYAFLQVKDQLARIPGVGDVTVFGARDYSMRIWLDPERLATRNLTAGDVVRAIREQNLQVAAGTIGNACFAGNDFQLTVSAGAIWMNSSSGDHRGARRSVVTFDVARVELAARDSRFPPTQRQPAAPS